MKQSVMTNNNIALEIKNLNVTLRNRRVLEDVSLELPAGSFMGLIGPNGGGKTVLLRTILNLIKADSGSINIFGEPHASGKKYVGYVPQFARFDYSFPVSVLDVVLMGCLRDTRPFLGYTDDQKKRAISILDSLDLPDVHESQIGKLSGGQLQRVLIARALISQPKLLILDEPAASLDTKVGRSFHELLKELSTEMTIILVSHDLGVISQDVKTIACLNRTLHYHDTKELQSDVLEEVYGCPVELLAHGHAHRVLSCHDHSECGHDHGSDDKSKSKDGGQNDL